MLRKFLSLLIIATMLIPTGTCLCDAETRCCSKTGTRQQAPGKQCSHSRHKSRCPASNPHPHPEPEGHHENEKPFLPHKDHQPSCPTVAGSPPVARLSSGEAVDLLLVVDSGPVQFLGTIPIFSQGVLDHDSRSPLREKMPLYLTLRTLLI